MKIITWNVNGIRSILKKGFEDSINEMSPDIICLQEVKSFQNQCKSILPNYDLIWHNGIKPGYSGVATFYRKDILKYKSHKFKFDNDTFFDSEGRVLEVEFDSFVLINIYFPNGKNRKGFTDILEKKIDFYKHFNSHINNLKSIGKNIIICGDYNIAHTEIDLANPESNKNSVGFTIEERECLNRLVNSNFIDVFRYFNKDKKDIYTWWSYITKARQRNIGWRIDYIFVNDNLISKIENTKVYSDIMGSDHCPVSINIKL